MQTSELEVETSNPDVTMRVFVDVVDTVIDFLVDKRSEMLLLACARIEVVSAGIETATPYRAIASSTDGQEPGCMLEVHLRIAALSCASLGEFASTSIVP